MKCPECGVTTPPGSEECSACGIIFSRWVNHPIRPSLSATPLPPPAASEPRSIPKPLLIAGVIVFVVIGIFWTSHRRAARATQNGAVSLDDINNSGEAGRERARQDAAKAAGGSSTPALPPTLTEQGLRALIEADPLFQDNLLVSVPKSFDAADFRAVAAKYPSLASANAEGLIEFDPPFDPKNRRPSDGYVEVKVPSVALYKVETIRDRDDTYEIDLGKRALDTVTVKSATDSKVEAAFTFTYEHEIGNTLKPDGSSRKGQASLTRGENGWQLDSVKRK